MSMRSLTITPEEQTLRRRAAVPNLILGGLFAGAVLFARLTGDHSRWLASMMVIEIFVIHSFPFMMLIASYEPATERGKKFQKGLFWTVLIFYILHALKAGGVPGAVAFAGLTVSTYLGYLLRRSSPDAVTQLVARWVMSFFVFLVGSMMTGSESDLYTWSGARSTLLLGMLYFTSLGLLEWKGFYQITKVQQIAKHIEIIFNKKARKD